MHSKYKVYRELFDKFLIDNGVKDDFSNALMYRGTLTSDYEAFMDHFEYCGFTPRLFFYAAFEWGAGEEMVKWATLNNKWLQILKTYVH